MKTEEPKSPLKTKSPGKSPRKSPMKFKVKLTPKVKPKQVFNPFGLDLSSNVEKILGTDS